LICATRNKRDLARIANSPPGVLYSPCGSNEGPPQRALRRLNQGVYRSGQTGQTVNLVALPSKVRILPRPIIITSPSPPSYCAVRCHPTPSIRRRPHLRSSGRSASRRWFPRKDCRQPVRAEKPSALGSCKENSPAHLPAASTPDDPWRYRDTYSSTPGKAARITAHFRRSPFPPPLRASS